MLILVLNECIEVWIYKSDLQQQICVVIIAGKITITCWWHQSSYRAHHGGLSWSHSLTFFTTRWHQRTHWVSWTPNRWCNPPYSPCRCQKNNAFLPLHCMSWSFKWIASCQYIFNMGVWYIYMVSNHKDKWHSGQHLPIFDKIIVSLAIFWVLLFLNRLISQCVFHAIFQTFIRPKVIQHVFLTCFPKENTNWGYYITLFLLVCENKKTFSTMSV